MSLIHLYEIDTLQTLRDIFSVSVKNNTRQNITGLLMIDVKCIIQVLEGSRSDIYNLFKKIEVDNRHTDVNLFELKKVSSRNFGKWSMAGSIRMQRHDEIYRAHGINGPIEPEFLSSDIIISLGNKLLANHCVNGGPGAVSWQIRRAIEIIDARIDGSMTVRDLASELGIGIRALELGFQRHKQTTPHAYMKRAALEAARRELLCGGVAIGDVARRWGFMNSGRFAMEYRAEFGEEPSRTKREA